MGTAITPRGSVKSFFTNNDPKGDVTCTERFYQNLITGFLGRWMLVTLCFIDDNRQKVSLQYAI